MTTIITTWVPTGMRWRRAVLSVMPGREPRLEEAKVCYEAEQHAHASVQERINNAMKLHKEFGVSITHEWTKVRPV